MSTNLSINTAFANANTAYLVKYAELYEKALPGAYGVYTDTITGVTDLTTEFDWLTNHPVMREWIGERQVKFFRAYTQQVKLKKFEVTVGFDRMTVVYGDRSGAVARGLKSFLGRNVSAYDKDAYSRYMMSTGAGPIGFDGVALFSTAHPHSATGGNQSNLAAATNLNIPNFDAAQTAMESWQFENGEPAEASGDTLLIGPALKQRARQMFGGSTRLITVDVNGKTDATASVVAAGAVANTYEGELTIVVDSRRIGAAAFYWDLIDTKKPGIRPMVQLVGRAPTPINQDQMTDPLRFFNDQMYWGLEGEWVFDAGHWMSAYRATGTA